MHSPEASRNTILLLRHIVSMVRTSYCSSTCACASESQDVVFKHHVRLRKVLERLLVSSDTAAALASTAAPVRSEQQRAFLGNKQQFQCFRDTDTKYFDCLMYECILDDRLGAWNRHVVF